jgi:hypothetical protein
MLAALHLEPMPWPAYAGLAVFAVVVIGLGACLAVNVWRRMTSLDRDTWQPGEPCDLNSTTDERN